MEINKSKNLLWGMSVLGLSLVSMANDPSLTFAATPNHNGLVKGSSEGLPAAKTEKTNIVYIVLDDMGFSDFGSYGSEIKTPNIDKLAEDGLRYNNFTVCPVCSPTRASLLTGRDNHTVGMAQVSRVDFGITVPDSRGRVTNRAATIAQILKDNGYTTLAVGKWHLAPLHHVSPVGPYDYWPLAKGFDRYYGFLDGETDQYDPQLTYDNQQFELPKKKGYHLSEDLVDKANLFLTDAASVAPEKPFFLYLGFGAVHAPIQVPKEYIDMYKGVYDQGWDKIREARFARQKQLGLIPADAELTPRDKTVQQWDSLSVEEKKVFTQFMQTYAGFLTHADAQIGRFVEHLKAIGQYDNTMIVVISDNGAVGAGGEEGSDYLAAGNGLKGENSPSIVKKYAKRLETIGGPEVEGLYQKGWGMVSNTPFKGYKGSVYAGGTRVPLIVHWPGKIAAEGQVRNQPVYVTDVTPMVLDVLKLDAPTTYHGIDQLPMDGKSFAQTFDQPNAKSEHQVYYNLLHTRASLQKGTGNRSITEGSWKAVINQKEVKGEKPAWELYNLAEDYAEVHDLSAQYPEKLKHLQALWKTEAERHGAVIQGVPGPTDAANRANVMKFLPGTGFLGKSAAPNLYNKSYTITVPITRDKKSEEGVLVAHGDHFAGYTLYVMNNHLVYEFNDFGEVTRIVSKEQLPIGSAVVKFKFDKAEKGDGGTATLFVNDKLVGEKEVPRVARIISMEGISFGVDMYSPVSPAYKNKDGFKFTGKYDYVRYEMQKKGTEFQGL
ncbi:arylsulfatase [Anaerosinus massiliensis]|uniref:arylsulfatase n=1 Tax=Massilibacillus massiliensis TaxID=1806837 RepID=UPI000B2E4C0E|nr:arylsulfatase [Massilibacillus massiliensis]